MIIQYKNRQTNINLCRGCLNSCVAWTGGVGNSSTSSEYEYCNESQHRHAEHHFLHYDYLHIYQSTAPCSPFLSPCP